jgi:hypothetical protein
MGFDVYGKRKDTYFRNNVWYWKPLWEYVAETCALTEKEYEAGLSNDAKFISKNKADNIAETLFKELKANRTQTYDLKYKKRIKNLPYVACSICNGTGVRNDKHMKGDCNACNTERTRLEGIPIGKALQWEASYPFDVDNVKEFAEFCKESDGFEIC